MQDWIHDSTGAVNTLLHEHVRYDAALNLGDEPRPLAQRLKVLHEELRSKWSMTPINRVSIAIYHPSTDIATTYIESCIGMPPMGHFEMQLAETEALHRIADTRSVRTIDAIPANAPGRLGVLYRAGARSSMTAPIYGRGGLLGFIFFDANVPYFFAPSIADRLSVYAKVIALYLVQELLSVRLVQAVTKTAREMARLRDDETGSHLERMSNFARLIAIEGAGYWNLSDEFIEHLYWFAPLHDIGKVGVPDGILLKPGKLTETEMAEMRLHVAHGVAIIDAVGQEFGLDAMPNLSIARNIIACHHENLDGSGYPNGTAGSAIPIEARIVAVADVFDALTSERPYKRAWSNQAAIDHMRNLVGTKFDGDCVNMFLRRLDDVTAIQQRYQAD